MSQDPRTFNKEDKVTWDELAVSLQQLITQIKTDLANEIIDRKAVCEKLQKEIDALFDKDGHLVFPNGNTIWIDANNGTLPSTGTGSVTEVSDVTFDQLDNNMQDRLNDDKAGIAQALSEIEELKKSIQANADEITKLKAQLAASGAAAAAGGGGLFVDYPSGTCVASGRDELSYEFTAAENCAISITCDYEGAHIAGTFTGTLRVNATATSVGPNTLADGFLFFKKGDTVMITLTASNPESTLSIIQYKLRKSSSGIKLNFSGKVIYHGSARDLVASGRSEACYKFTAEENCAINITCDYEGAAGTFTGTLRVNATATSVGPNTLADGLLFFKKGDTVMITLTASNPESILFIFQYKLRKSSDKVIYHCSASDLVVTIPDDGFITAGGTASIHYHYIAINGVAICDNLMGSVPGSPEGIGFGSVPVSKGDTLTCGVNTIVYFFPLAH